MSSYHWLNVTQNEIMDTIESPINKKITESIFNAFLSNGLRFKTRAESIPKDLLPLHGYKVYFYIKGSKETIILNTFFFHIQLRINNRSTLDKLEEYSENICNAILTAWPCKACPNNEGLFHGHGEYVFTFQGKEYRKCQMLCSNFNIHNLNESDIDSLNDIINREISFMKLNPTK